LVVIAVGHAEIDMAFRKAWVRLGGAGKFADGLITESLAVQGIAKIVMRVDRVWVVSDGGSVRYDSFLILSRVR